MSSSRKANLAMFNNSDDDEPAFQHKALDDSKLQQYTQGSVRKSRKDKEREAAEAKKKEEEAKAAEAYAEFLDDFQADQAEQRSRRGGFVKAGEVPSGPSAAQAPPPVKGRGQTRAAPAPLFDDRGSPERGSPPLGGKPRGKGKRAMDAFLEEIKRDQAEREDRQKRYGGTKASSVSASAAYEPQKGSRDTGDPHTTNIFVANLPANVTENALGMFFARSGPVGSVKIMWPRHDEPSAMPGGPPTGPRRSAGLSGFVSFMKRKDAEAAVRDLDGLEWNGSALRVGWSKAVPVAARAMFDLGAGASSKKGRSRSRSPERPAKRRRSRSYSPSPPRARYRSRSRSVERDRDRDRGKDYDRRRNRSYSRSRSPSRSPARARRSTRHSRSRSPGYSLSRSRSPRNRRRNDSRDRHADSGSSRRRKSPEPIPFDDDGANSVYSTDSAEESEKEHTRKGVLGKLALRRFESLLRGLSGKRGEIAKCMAFCLDHSDAASQLAAIILRSLQVDSTPVPRKVARLHLVCDILHNSAASVTNAWKFRQEFDAGLGSVFDHMSSIYQSFPGRITAETFKKQITAVLDVWEDWIVFPPDKTADYRARLDGAPREEEKEEEKEEEEEREEAPVFSSKFKASAFKPATEVEDEGGDAEDKELDGEPVDDVDGEPVVSALDGEPLDDLDGQPMDDVDGVPLDVDGEPMDDVDGAPLDDLDGVPLDDVDGVPLPEVSRTSMDDVDGAPLDDVDGEPAEEAEDEPMEIDAD